MKILIASDTYPPDVNGAAYFSYRLAMVLAKRGHEASVICPSRGLRTQTSLRQGVRVLGAHFLPLLLYPEFRVSPPLLEALVANLRLKDRVTFLGHLSEEDVPRLYRAADVFVMAGVAELQSIATMEAMASGLPVIAANAMALPELVHHGENGFLFPEDDAQALAAAAVTILSNEPLRRQMAKKSLEIIKVHDINKVVEQYERLYALMVAGDAH